MGLLSFFKRARPAPAAKSVSDSVDAVQQLRLRARHRLIGAAVLVGLGVIGFPLLFETQPRPIPVDLPIEIPAKDHVAALKVPAALPSSPLAASSAPGHAGAAQPTQTLPAALPTPELDANAASKQAAPPSPAPESSKPAQAKPAESKPEPKSDAKAESRGEPKPTPPVSKSAEKPQDKASDKAADKVADKAAERARAQETRPEAKHQGQEAARVQSLLEGKAVDARGSDGSARLVVQVGAYADSKAAQEVRLKLEKLGMKTYTQVAKTTAGDRIRVRVGPFASREEADKAAARIRAAGLSTAVLTL